jgi:hypothetical protein
MGSRDRALPCVDCRRFLDRQSAPFGTRCPMVCRLARVMQRRPGWIFAAYSMAAYERSL